MHGARGIPCLSVATCLLLVNLAGAATPPPKPTPERGKVEPPSIEDLFEVGQDSCERGEYDLAFWPLRRAADLARTDPGPQLWLAHTMIQVGLVKDGKAKLSAIEKTLSAGRPKEGSSASLYLACARNYLGVMAAIEKARPQAAAWFEKASGQTAASAAQPPHPAPAKAAGDTLIAQERILREIAEGNKKMLESGSAFTAWIPPVLPLPPATSLKTGPGQAKNYIRTANARWRTVSKQPPMPLADSKTPSSTPRTTGYVPKPAVRARSVEVIPVTVQLLDAQSAVTAARISAEKGNLAEALRLGETARSLEPDLVDAHLLLADVYEARNWLVESLESLEIAAAKATDDRKQAAQNAAVALAKNNPEFALEPKGLLIGKNFRIRFATTPAQAQAMLVLLEQAHQAAQTTFPVSLPVTYVRLFPTGTSLLQYTALAKGKPPPNWVGGYAATTATGAEIMLEAELPPASVLHEYAHVILRTLAGPGDLPRWLDEGLAQVIEKGRQLTSDFARRAFISNQLPGPDKVEAFFTNGERKRNATSEQAHLYYESAYGAVSFLLTNRGEAGVIEWLLAIRRGGPANESFEKLFGLTPEQFFQTWAQTCLR
jgi:tetratricopeptide (TPR) repeat protein